jgi:uncharacterized protein (UPF0332 family)/predicted nucleotidyltransferase
MVKRTEASHRRKTHKPRTAREKSAVYKTTPRPRLTRAEARAVADFRACLKEILPNGELRSLILYGSKARGDARPGSDIDLLVVYDSARGDKKDAIWDAAYEICTSSETAPDLQPFVLSKTELVQDVALGMPLLQNVAREGIVLEGDTVKPQEMDRKHWTQVYIQDAKQQLDSARVLLERGDIRRAISLAYFIYLDAARAALISKGIAPQSHAGTNTLFGLHFIKTGLLPKKFGPHFGRLEQDRLEATYAKKKQYTKEDADRALNIAEELVIAVEGLIPTLLAEEE